MMSDEVQRWKGEGDAGDALRVRGAPNLSGFSMMSLARSPSISKGDPLGANEGEDSNKVIGRLMTVVKVDKSQHR